MNPLNTKIEIDKSWTLFLDRDGVINEETVGTYITDWDDFVFCDGTLEALERLSQIFGTIVVVTNQRGVGRGIMSLDDLKDINSKMTTSILAAGGRIDKIYACTAVSNDDHNRKPNVGMALQAKEDFDHINFKKSIVIGNSFSDMEFGKRLAMHTVFLTTKHPPVDLPSDLVDEQYPLLINYAATLSMPTSSLVSG
jgi:histidinol-phosphate phosphatase family protein